jgi:hypothetical protein
MDESSEAKPRLRLYRHPSDREVILVLPAGANEVSAPFLNRTALLTKHSESPLSEK